MTSGPELSVLICTCRRGAWLEELVASIGADAVDRPELELVVVDNDPAGSALPSLRRLARGALPLRATHLAEPNIAAARNLALSLARAPRVLFLDDDQWVPPGFFAALTLGWRRRPHWASGVRPSVAYVGDVHAPLPPSQPPLFGWPLHPITRESFATNGLLIERSVLTALGSAPFDPAFGLTGGEDTELFLRLERRGARIVLCPEARLAERRPEAHWVDALAREFRIGMADALIALEREGQERLAYAAKKLGAGAMRTGLRALRGPMRGDPFDAFRPWRAARLAGLAFALVGGRWEPYRRGGRARRSM